MKRQLEETAGRNPRGGGGGCDLDDGDACSEAVPSRGAPRKHPHRRFDNLWFIAPEEVAMTVRDGARAVDHPDDVGVEPR